LKIYCSLVLNARIVSWVKVIKQITPSVIINVMYHLRLFTLIYGVLYPLRLLLALDGSPDSPTLFDAMQYSLPHRHNREIPPNRYSPETEGRKSKYSIANFISAHNMSNTTNIFIGKVSSE
jgi:hypothetical protein